MHTSYYFGVVDIFIRTQSDYGDVKRAYQLIRAKILRSQSIQTNIISEIRIYIFDMWNCINFYRSTYRASACIVDYENS
jgi:hypothetical protein